MFNLTSPEQFSNGVTDDSNINTTSSPQLQQELFLPCDNPENILPKITADTVKRVFQIGVLPLLELFGVAGNLLNCVVFTRNGLGDRINLCLFCLSVADAGFLISIFIAKNHSLLALFDDELERFWSAAYVAYTPTFVLGFLNLSNLLTMVISLERCACVLFPFTAKRIMKTKYMAVAVVAVCTTFFGLYSLINTQFLVVRLQDAKGDQTRWVLKVSTFYLNNRALVDGITVMSIWVPCISIAVVATATAVTVGRLRLTVIQRQELTQDQQTVTKETAVTNMLIAVCVVYVTCLTPSVTQMLCRSFLPGYHPSEKYCNLFAVLQTFSNLLEVTNSSVNVLVYLTMGSRFRSTARSIFRIRRFEESHRNKKRDLSGVTVSGALSSIDSAKQ
ncbi:hypothetical protein BaRGS_00007575 [Batillaria attramentaria]|uniref:G-protein coupled receptors family 1 profile domain-containing protein n=1 Tax=Batillaria attramentaria TaxID=370345 RepID=A0ABD0LPF3_9CAEN